jgi:acetyl esterase/lipase
MLLRGALIPMSLPLVNLNAYARQRSEARSGSFTIPLWPEGRIPDGPGPSGPEIVSSTGSVRNISVPRLVIYPAERPNGAAMMVSSGGGYAHIERGTESIPACQWLQSIGVTAFELIYRLPGEGWPKTAPLQDGQRAMRIIRSMARKMPYRSHRIGVMGFSAGGHLAGMTETTPTVERYRSVDEIDAISSAPNFAALLYPVLTLVPPYDHTHTLKSIAGDHPSMPVLEALSVDFQVTPATPPTFLAQAKDDPISPVENSERMYKALQSAHVESELILFDTGGHGWGLGKRGTEEQSWPSHFATWTKKNGFFEAS